jgi:hypothetical protein
MPAGRVARFKPEIDAWSPKSVGHPTPALIHAPWSAGGVRHRDVIAQPRD